MAPPRKIQKSGFTLIEILFVLAILGVIAAAGMSLLKIKAQQFKVDKTALQIQQVLQAGMSYYVDRTEWPIDYVTGTTTAAPCPGTDPFCGYLPVATLQDPWGNDYNWKKIAVAQGATTCKFRVCTQTSYSKELASKIAAQLPSAKVSASCVSDTAECSGETCAVLAEVGLPNQSITPPSGTVVIKNIASVHIPPYVDGSCSINSNDTCNLSMLATAPAGSTPYLQYFSCDSGFARHVILVPANINFNPKAESAHALPAGAWLTQITLSDLNCIIGTDTCSATVKLVANGIVKHNILDTGGLDLTYIEYCRKVSS